MADAIEISKKFPASRERTVLMELLKIARTLKQENIEAVICGGWVPFLKELAHHSQAAHNMSLDIDVLLRAKARERESIDRIKNLLSEPLAFEPSKTDAFRYEKNVEGYVVQLDLLADQARKREDESVLKNPGSDIKPSSLPGRRRRKSGQSHRDDPDQLPGGRECRDLRDYRS
jgi:hypothetical protein